MPHPTPAPAAIFFDIDDTLLDDHAATSAGLRTMMERLGHPDFTAARRLWDIQTDISLNAFIAGRLTLAEQRRERVRALASQAGHSHVTDETSDQLYQDYLQSHRAAWQTFSDVNHALNQLAAAGIALGVVTNGIETLQHDKLATLNLAHHFQVVLCADTAGTGKPDPQIFHAACQRINLSPTQCWHVGDQLHADALGALTAGLRPILVDRHGNNRDHTDITTIAELGELPPLTNGAQPQPHLAHAQAMTPPDGEAPPVASSPTHHEGTTPNPDNI